MKKFLPLLILLSGCWKVGPNFEEPCVPCKHEWMESECTSDPVCQWWTLFDDSILDHFIWIAKEQNLPLQIAAYRILEARARLGFAVGEFFPQFQQGFGSADRVKVSKHQPNTALAPDIYFSDYQLGFNTIWELDFWGKYRRAIETEQKELCASYADYDNVLVLLLSDVAATYIRLRTIDELIEIVNHNIKIQARGLEITEAQFEGGFVSELDKQQALTLLRDTQARLPDLQKQRRQTENALSVLLGIPPEELTDSGSIPFIPEELTVSCPETLLCRRPDVRQAFYSAAAQSARIGVAFADFFPQVSLRGTIGTRSGDSSLNAAMSPGNLLDRDSLTFTYGAQVEWPILNYGRIGNRVKIEKARFCQLITNYQDTILVAYKEVEDGLVGFYKSHEQLGFLGDSVKAAQRSVDLSKTQYVEGMVDYTRVLNTQQSLLSEQEKYVNTKGSIALSLINTYKALGGGWEIKCD